MMRFDGSEESEQRSQAVTRKHCVSQTAGSSVEV